MAIRENTSNGRDGLLVDKWNWKYNGVKESLAAGLRGEDDDPLEGAGKDVQLVGEQVVPIEVRLLKQAKGDSLPRVESSVEFVVICKALGIRLQGPDIEALRKAMWSRLEKEFEIKWEPWLLVTIAPARSHRGDMETGFALSENTIYRGEAKDGSILMREYERGRTFSPWRYKPWLGEYRTEDGAVIACIKATPENERAMKEFRARIRELQKRLSDLVKPHAIVQTLADLSGVGLPAPSAESLADDDED